MHLERSFEHVLDEVDYDAPLSSEQTISPKATRSSQTCFNLSLLMRTLVGVGTPKQWIAGAYTWLKTLLAYLASGTSCFRKPSPKPRSPPCFPQSPQNPKRSMKPTVQFSSIARLLVCLFAAFYVRFRPITNSF